MGTWIKTLMIILVIVILSSCKAKTVYKREIVHDTIVEVRIERILQPYETIVEIESPCDSLGNLKPIFFESKGEGKTISIKSVGNKIEIIEKVDTVIVYKDVFKEHISTSDNLEIKEIRYIPKWVWYSLGLNLILLVWTFRKFIGIPI